MLFFLLKGLGFHLNYDQKLHLKGGNKLWWPVRTNGDTSERKCAIVFGSASATYPLTRDSYGQPWLTVWLQNSGASGQIFPPDRLNCWPGGHLSPLISFSVLYLNLCVWACVSMCLACDKPQPPSAGELSNHNLWWTWLRLKQCSARCVKPLQRVLNCMFVQSNKFCIERWASTTHL